MGSILERTVDTEIIKGTVRTEPRYDYLKYLQIVMTWALEKHPEINRRDLELLFFLYSERVFTKTEIIKYANFITWDKNRFYRLLKDDWISEERRRTPYRYPVYSLSRKGRGLVNSVYKKLNQEEHISEWHQHNPLFKKQKVGRKNNLIQPFIKKNNEEVKKKRLV